LVQAGTSFANAVHWSLSQAEYSSEPGIQQRGHAPTHCVGGTEPDRFGQTNDQRNPGKRPNCVPPWNIRPRSTNAPWRAGVAGLATGLGGGALQRRHRAVSERRRSGPEIPPLPPRADGPDRLGCQHGLGQGELLALLPIPWREDQPPDALRDVREPSCEGDGAGTSRCLGQRRQAGDYYGLLGCPTPPPPWWTSPPRSASGLEA
jgi:hypothetical protein